MHPGYERQIPKLTSYKNLQTAKGLLGHDATVCARLTRERIGDLELLDTRIGEVTKEMRPRSRTRRQR